MKFYFQLFLFFLISVPFFVSCRNKEYDESINNMYTNPIDLRLDRYLCLSKDNDREKARECLFFLVHYLESSSCNSCTLNATKEWTDRIQRDHFYDSIRTIIIFSPYKKDIKNFKNLYITSDLETDIYIDTCQLFMTSNRHLPDNEVFHTFIIDTMNNIRLVGDPIRNPRIGSMLKSIVREEL